MTTSSLRAVTLKTVANYAHAAERAVLAYRVGGHRLIAAMQRGVDLAAQNGPERLATALRRAGGNVGGMAGKGLDKVSRGTERAIEIGSSGVRSQVVRVADMAEGLDLPVLSSGLQAAARISLPGAQAALVLSERVVAGADKLPGTPAAKADAKLNASVARNRRQARKAAKPQTTVEAVVREVKQGAAKARKAAAPVVAELKAAVKPRAARKPAPQVSAKPSVKASTKASTKANVKAVTQPLKAAAKANATRVRRAAKSQPVAAAVAAVQDAVAA